MDLQKLTNDEIADLLRRVDPSSPLGTRLFEAVMRLSVAPAFEAVCLRSRPNDLEVLLTQRASDDTAYPGMWHCPGTFYRPGEDDEACVRRLGAKEGVTITSAMFVGKWNNPYEARGHCMHLVHLCKVDGAPAGQWFPLGALPQPMVDFHRDVIIQMAVGRFDALLLD